MKVKKVRIFLLVFIAGTFIFASAGAPFAATLKVPSQFVTIQDAVDHSKSGDTVIVSEGTYKGNIRLREGIVLQGAGAEDTVIEGDGTGSVIEGAKGAVIEGFTITGSGKKGSIGTTMDAGISANNAPMTIANNRIINNNTGIKLYYSPSNVINNVISGSARHGVYLSYSDSKVKNNIITGSKSYGIYNSYCKPELINNTIHGNATGIYSELSTVVVKNNIITKNTGNGISWSELIGSQEGGEPILSYNLVWGNGRDRVNVKPAAGDISKDPFFKDAKLGDFRLKKGSPAKGAGEKGSDMGAFGGDDAQASIPVAPSEKSYASLKPSTEASKEPDYMSQQAWQEGTKSGSGNFESFCVPCHGPMGQGDGILADTLDVRPRNLSDAKLMSTRKDEFLFGVIKNGGPSVGFSENMAPFSNTFSDEEIKNLVSYIRSDICKCKYKGD